MTGLPSAEREKQKNGLVSAPTAIRLNVVYILASVRLINFDSSTSGDAAATDPCGEREVHRRRGTWMSDRQPVLQE
jgi:hypothetical protein